MAHEAKTWQGQDVEDPARAAAWLNDVETDLATNGNGGSSSVIGTSYLIADGAGQADIAGGDESAHVVFTEADSAGNDITLSGDGTTVNIETDGWYQVTWYVGNNGAPSFQANVRGGGTAPSWDVYIGCPLLAADVIVSSPMVHLLAGDSFYCTGYADGSDPWTLEGGPNKLTIQRFA